MGTETWVHDSTDYGVVPIPTTYFNQTKDNINVLHKGNGQSSLTTIATSSNFLLDIGSTDQVFNVDLTAAYDIKFITTTNREVGNTIILLFKDGGTGYDIHNNAASPPAGSVPILISGSGLTLSSYNLFDYSKIELTLGDEYWYCNPYGFLL